MNHTDTMSLQEYAALVRDAHELIDAVERTIRRTGAVFVTASTLTVVAMVADLTTAGVVTAVIAVAAFVAALLAVITRIILGEAPEPLDDESYPAVGVVQVVNRPTTGSAATTPENGVIPPM